MGSVPTRSLVDQGHPCSKVRVTWARLYAVHTKLCTSDIAARTQFCWLDALKVQKLRDAVPKDFCIFSNPLSERIKQPEQAMAVFQIPKSGSSGCLRAQEPRGWPRDGSSPMSLGCIRSSLL